MVNAAHCILCGVNNGAATRYRTRTAFENRCLGNIVPCRGGMECTVPAGAVFSFTKIDCGTPLEYLEVFVIVTC